MSEPLQELAELASALGGAPWVQGPGGNASVKDGDQLWVKASGVRLAELALPHGHVRVPLATVRAALAGDEAADRALFAHTPRPSLETYFHALGARIVAHTHALGALLYACSSAPFVARPESNVFAVRYLRPGRGVARAIEEQRGDAQLCVLRSHGIIAYADSTREAIELSQRFDEQVRQQFCETGPLAPFELDAYFGGAQQALEHGVYRALPERCVSAPRYLFPDACVCASVVLVPSLADPHGSAVRALQTLGRACVLVDPSGQRIAVAHGETQLQQTCELTAAHDWLEDALCARGQASYLPPEEASGIIGLPSEQYRIQLAALRG